jgi:hypothetical protein
MNVEKKILMLVLAIKEALLQTAPELSVPVHVKNFLRPLSPSNPKIIHHECKK